MIPYSHRYSQAAAAWGGLGRRYEVRLRLSAFELNSDEQRFFGPLLCSDPAKFMLQQTSSPQYVRRAVGVAN
jgi:hypothetical protein